MKEIIEIISSERKKLENEIMSFRSGISDDERALEKDKKSLEELERKLEGFNKFLSDHGELNRKIGVA